MLVMRRAALGLALIVSAPALAQTCDSPSAPTEVEGHASAALTAFSQGDEGQFNIAMNALGASIPCLSEPITTSQAGPMHRAYALKSYVELAGPSVGAALGAAKLVDPGWEFGQLLPPEHNLRQLWPALPTVGAIEELPEPADNVQIYFDGRATTERPLAASTIMQVVTDSKVTASGYLWPGMGPLAYAIPQIKKKKKCPGVPLLAAAGASAIAAAGLKVGNLAAHSAYTKTFEDSSYNVPPNSDKTPVELANSRYRTSNGLFHAANGAGLAALGLATGGVVCVAW
jgi:hypothetical protein